MDYIFLDQHVIDAASARTRPPEQPVLLPSIFAFEAKPPTPAVTPLGPDPWFGSFHRREKLNRDTLALWTRVLEAVPQARMLFKAAPFEDKLAQEDVLRGLGPGVRDRVGIEGRTSFYQHLARHAQIDLMLDPFPHAGGVTTLESLWMGVPVITLEGSTIAGRLSTSFLRQAGLDVFIAKTPDEYVRIAAEWIGPRRGELALVRQGVRERVQAAPFMQLDSYTKAVEAEYRRMWAAFCAREARRRRQWQG